MQSKGMQPLGNAMLQAGVSVALQQVHGGPLHPPAPAPFPIQNYPSATFAGMGPFTKTFNSSTLNSSQPTLPALDMPILRFAVSSRTGQNAMSNLPHHHLPENPSA